MKTTGIWIGKAFIVWLVVMVTQMAGGMIGMAVTHAPPMPAGDGPLDATQASLITNLLFALALAAQASNMPLKWAQKAIVLFAILFGVETVQSLIEAVYFGTYLKLGAATYGLSIVSNGIKAAFAAMTAAGLWRSAAAQGLSWPRGLWWKLVVISPIYVVFYFAAGAMIAWQGEAVRAYYQQGAHINVGQLALLQIFRGLLWGGLATLSVAAIEGGKMRKALLTGTAFAVFMAATLLYPISFMPWAVRQFHIAEISTSNFLFGIIAALILSIGMKKRA